MRWNEHRKQDRPWGDWETVIRRIQRTHFKTRTKIEITKTKEKSVTAISAKENPFETELAVSNCRSRQDLRGKVETEAVYLQHRNWIPA